MTEVITRRGQLKENVSQKLWKGPDIHLASFGELPQGRHSMTFLITPYSLPPFHGIPDVLEHIANGNIPLKDSARSRYGQVFGLEMAKHTGRHLAEQLLLKGAKLNEGKLSESIDVNLDVINHSTRTARFDPKSGIFRLYTDWTQKMIKGEELEGLFQDKVIKIDGPWQWKYKKGKDCTPTNIVGVYVPIGNERNWIPRDERDQSEHLQISDTSQNFREEIGNYLKPVPLKTTRRILYLVKTPRTTLGRDAILSEKVYSYHSDGDMASGNFVECHDARQIRSLALDRGKTNGQTAYSDIVIEIFGKIRKHSMPTHVHLSFY